MAITFGFLGAYFFALNTISRRYMRADLKPKAYTSITVRIFIVAILSWVVGVVSNGQNPYVLVTVFFIGIFPESGLTLIQESLRGGGRLFPSNREKHPLTKLEEIDIYDRARLLDEGVTNIESLAHHDIIDLMLETRIPLPRLVDWIDQAILYLHLPDRNGTTGNKANEGKSSISLKWLQSYGVRTTTDLIKAYGKKGDGTLCKMLAKDQAKLDELGVLLDVLEDDEWLNYIENWRANCDTEEVSIKFGNNGEPIIEKSKIIQRKPGAISGPSCEPGEKKKRSAAKAKKIDLSPAPQN